MLIHFWKYQGAGNDFILFDTRNQELNLETEKIELLCNRRFGIGADGLILLKSSELHDFKMHYFNSDGNESSFCGNGGRCIIHFAHFLGIFTDETTFEAFDGLHHGRILKNGLVELSMNHTSRCQSIPAGELLNTGSPHLILRTDDLDAVDVIRDGSKLRYDSSISADGVNVNFVQQISENHLAVRTYERGVEDETLACGTGITAAALASVKNSPAGDYLIDIDAKGGSLQVQFHFNPENDYPYTQIKLIGPAVRVFEGWIELG